MTTSCKTANRSCKTANHSCKTANHPCKTANHPCGTGHRFSVACRRPSSQARAGTIILSLLLTAPILRAAEDPVLKAMRDELQRSMTLQFNALEKPYYLEYLMEDAHRVQVGAMLDGVLSVDQSDYRIPRVQIRVGTPQFDNTNYVGSRASYSGRYSASFPLDDDYATLRHSFWLAT